MMTDLFACAQGTERQSTKLSVLMVLSVLGYVLRSCEGYGYVCGSHVNSSKPAQLCRAGSSSFAHAMPRIRGRPRRGVGWYVAESRRKCHKKFAQAIRVARRKCRAIATTVLSPPRTFGEEDPPQPSIALSETFAPCIVEEEIPGCAVKEEIPDRITGEQEHPPIAITLGDPPQPSIAPSETYATCIVEEELPDCDTKEQDHVTSSGSKNRGPESK